MKLDVAHIGQLASLPLTADEIKKFEKQLADTLTYIESLQEVDTKHLQPTAHVTGLENITRVDKAAETLIQKQALSNTTKTHDGFFVVDQLIDNE